MGLLQCDARTRVAMRQMLPASSNFPRLRWWLCSETSVTARLLFVHGLLGIEDAVNPEVLQECVSQLGQYQLYQIMMSGSD